MPEITHTTFIIGMVLAAFVLYLAAKNRLTTYENVLWGNVSQSSSASSSTSSSSSGTFFGIGGAVGNALSTVF